MFVPTVFEKSENSKMSKKPNATQFFWDKKATKNKSRFNLLLLEYGEYLMEDLSAFYFPIPTHDLSTTFEVKDSLKIQGRLKLSTRSLIFEPSEARYPIIKFPYKSIPSELELFNLKQSELGQLSVDVSGFFTFSTQSCFEMKENNKIGPYKQIDYVSTTGGAGHRSVFALVHGNVDQFLVKVEQLRHIFKVSQRQGTLFLVFGFCLVPFWICFCSSFVFLSISFHMILGKHLYSHWTVKFQNPNISSGSGAASQLLKPFIETAQLWTLQFDTSHLVNFHEQMLFPKPVAAQKIKPLIINPGSLMLTETRVYFQPSQLNNVGDSVLHFEVRLIARVFRRRYLLRQIGLEFILTDGTSHLFVLDNQNIRDSTYNLIVNLKALSPLARSCCETAPVGSASSSGSGGGGGSSLHMQAHLENLCRRWQRREISNFEYLMNLNTEADRSVNDLTQYPVSVCCIMCLSLCL